MEKENGGRGKTKNYVEYMWRSKGRGVLLHLIVDSVGHSLNGAMHPVYIIWLNSVDPFTPLQRFSSHIFILVQVCFFSLRCDILRSA